MTATVAERCQTYRARRSMGVRIATVEIRPEVCRALVRLGLLPEGPGRAELAYAVGRFLETAPAVASMGEALYPEAAQQHVS